MPREPFARRLAFTPTFTLTFTLTLTETFMLVLASTLAASVLAASSVATTDENTKPAEGVSLTVYSSADPAGFDPQRFVQQQRMSGMDNVWGVPGYGVVKVVRTVPVPKGIGTLAFTDVAAWIDPTTVSFTDLDDPSTAVLEQNFQFDLVSPTKLMERYIGREISVSVPMGDSVSNVTGELLSANQGQLVLKTADGVRIVPQGGQVQLGELPGGLLTKPTLMWKLASETGGDHLVRTTYQTSGMTWRADYNIVIDESDTAGSISAWVTLMNLSGASYPDAELKLVAGDVQKVEARGGMMGRAVRQEALAMADAAGFESKSFADFHLYTLPRRTDIAQNSTQQIALFPSVEGFTLKRELVFNFLSGIGGFGGGNMPVLDRDFFGNTMQAKPSIFVSFENKEENSLGMPFPAGKIRCYKMDDADGTLEFIGEDIISHTPRNETVKVRLGEAFDVVGERTRTDFSIDSAAKRMTETFRIEVRNQKAVAQKIRVIEPLYRWSNWKITMQNRGFTKIDSGTIAFDLDIPAEGKADISYTVTYTW
ncbi:MAG: DUF4139 domain-containing protein [Phycisphaera sp.]|nr:DUF4139 domain-containing protein [Phycisphaera sp.]